MNIIAQRHPEDNPGLGQLLPISPCLIGTQEVNAVSARALYAQLGLKQSNWSRWSNRNIEENEFATKGGDWVPLDPTEGFRPHGENLGGRPKNSLFTRKSDHGNFAKDFFLTIDFAKGPKEEYRFAMTGNRPVAEVCWLGNFESSQEVSNG